MEAVLGISGYNKVSTESRRLVVEVISARISSGRNVSQNYLVELRFNGQIFCTLSKESASSPQWNETFEFDPTEQADPSDDQTLDAYIYKVGRGRRNSKALLGKVQLGKASFFQHSGDAVPMSYQWKRYGPIFWHTKGELVLKAYLVEARDGTSGVDPLAELLSIISKDGAAPLQPGDSLVKEITNPCFERGRVVERMQYLYVRVVKARGLPDVDANGSLDPYVEVKLGDYKGCSKRLRRTQDPEWNTTFAFPLQDEESSSTATVDVTVNDRDLVKDEFVGMLSFDLVDILARSPHDTQLEPRWYQLLDCGRKRSAQGSLMLAIWVGSQDDPSYPHAWISDTADTGVSQLSGSSQLSGISSKVYENPSLCYLRVTVSEAHSIALTLDDEDRFTEVFVRARMGQQVHETGVKKLMSTSYAWHKEFMFVAAEPFDGDKLEISVCVRGGESPDSYDKIIGQTAVSLTSLEKRASNPSIHSLKGQWFDLQRPDLPQPEVQGRSNSTAFNTDNGDNSCMQICLQISFERGYRVLHEDDDITRSADKQLWSSQVGRLELGILGARGLTPIKDRNGKSTLDPYCVAKCGGKWVRTRTVIATRAPLFNEQYDWDVYDTATVLTLGVFDNCLIQRDETTGVNQDTNLGMVRIRISLLEPRRLYTYWYSLFILSPSGVKKMGEVRLAFRFSPASSLSMVKMCARPIKPRMHYTNPIPDEESDNLRRQALDAIFLRLNRMEPPLRREVLERMCSVPTNMWSLRRSKAQFNRVMSIISGFIYAAKWFDDVRLWRNPKITLLVHAIFLLVLCFHKLILPLLSLCVASMGVRNYWRRPRHPQHIDLSLSFAAPNAVHPDELDEEFDTYPSSRAGDVIKMRYDRLRSVAGRVQTVVGDIATLGERIQSLGSWRDPRATAFFEIFCLIAAFVLYFIPLKVVFAAAGCYIMRHPRFQAKPSLIWSFYSRLPSKTDNMIQ